jgi:hypothetical protein
MRTDPLGIGRRLIIGICADNGLMLVRWDMGFDFYQAAVMLPVAGRGARYSPSLDPPSLDSPSLDSPSLGLRG